MKTSKLSFLLVSVFLLAACSKESAEENTGQSAAIQHSAPAAEAIAANTPVVEIVPGLTMRITQEGTGAVAERGQDVKVHYTGWLYDAAAENARGQKFDSSLDRGQHFEFSLGGGRVIKGWDQGVVGMRVGETRELTIAPEMAYGDRSVGELIPSGSTLVFEISLAGLSGGETAEIE
jgi:FKBP-type peptidyl-prolyl cis-trans isomerase